MRPITAADLMNPHILTVRDDLSLPDLAAFLVSNQITGAPVQDAAGQLVGVVSVSDLAEASLEHGRHGLAALAAGDLAGEPGDEELTVRDIMTSHVVSVGEDATVSEVASKMLNGQVHRVVVIGGQEPTGIITSSDLLGLLVDER
jgi:CBS domain-containing protein